MSKLPADFVCQPTDVLSLAFLPRDVALEMAAASARQFIKDNPKAAARQIWNYRCDRCFCNAPVYQDNNLCWACDSGDQE